MTACNESLKADLLSEQQKRDWRTFEERDLAMLLDGRARERTLGMLRPWACHMPAESAASSAVPPSAGPGSLEHDRKRLLQDGMLLTADVARLHCEAEEAHTDVVTNLTGINRLLRDQIEAARICAQWKDPRPMHALFLQKVDRVVQELEPPDEEESGSAEEMEADA